MILCQFDRQRKFFSIFELPRLYFRTLSFFFRQKGTLTGAGGGGGGESFSDGGGGNLLAGDLGPSTPVYMLLKRF